MFNVFFLLLFHSFSSRLGAFLLYSVHAHTKRLHLSSNYTFITNTFSSLLAFVLFSIKLLKALLIKGGCLNMTKHFSQDICACVTHSHSLLVRFAKQAN